MIGAHFTEEYPDQVSARSASRRLRLARRLGILTGPRFCESCKAWHVVSVDKRITSFDAVLLRNVAMGFTGREIAEETGESARAVNERIRALMCWCHARTRAHLTLLAIYFGLADLSTMSLDQSEGSAST